MFKYIISGTFLVLALGYFLGPSYQVIEPDPVVPALPGDPERELLNQEQKVTGIKPGLEKGIQWAFQDKRRTEYALVYLHGFSASRKEMSPVVEQLGQRLLANVYFTRLTGHGLEDSEDLAKVRAGDWLQDGLEAISVARRIGLRVYLIGASTGGTIATWLGAKLGDSLSGIVLISPNFGVSTPGAALLAGPWGELAAKTLIGDTYEWEAKTKLMEKFWTLKYPSKALVPMMSLVAHVKGMELEQIDVPVVTMYSEQDPILDTAEIKKTHARFRNLANEIVSLNHIKSHILAGDGVNKTANSQILDQLVKQIRRMARMDGRLSAN